MTRLMDEPAELAELRREVAELRRGHRPEHGPGRRRHARPQHVRRTPSARHRPYARRRLTLLGGVLATATVLVVLTSTGTRHFAPPKAATLTGLDLRARIVAIARSQLGYSASPSRSYCNKFSAAWHAGAGGCPAGESSEQWCADFAAWVWRRAGASFAYGYGADEINAGAVSFYRWAVAAGRWHPATRAFRASSGDVAVYGLSLDGTPSAVHVAIVVSDPRRQAGPDVINGDGDRTGYSVVEAGEDELRADTGRGGGAVLAGYVSPL